MTDLEMTWSCAEAMGLNVEQTAPRQGRGVYIRFRWDADKRGVYQPLQNDEQAMALVKKLGLTIDPQEDVSPFTWRVCVVSADSDWDNQINASSTDLNRAIVECVAKMQREAGRE